MTLRDFIGNGNKPTIGNVLTILTMLFAIGGVWATVSADNADTKRRVDTVEKRTDEDRRDGKEDRKEIKQDVKDTKEIVQQIMRKLDALDAAQRERDRRGK